MAQILLYKEGVI